MINRDNNTNYCPFSFSETYTLNGQIFVLETKGFFLGGGCDDIHDIQQFCYIPLCGFKSQIGMKVLEQEEFRLAAVVVFLPALDE